MSRIQNAKTVTHWRMNIQDIRHTHTKLTRAMLSAAVPLKRPCIPLRGVRERLEVKINNHRSQSVIFLHMPCYEGQGSDVLILDCL